MRKLITIFILFGFLGCSDPMEGLLKSDKEAKVKIKFDLYHKPFPEIPLPNDVATTFDENSPTKRRINASLLAATAFERKTRELFDQLDGWGIFQPITIPFTGLIDLKEIEKRHRDKNYKQEDDLIYLVNVDKNSEEFGKVHFLDIGEGNYPVTMEKLDNYYEGDVRGFTNSLTFEEADEDLNQNGKMDEGEDLDLDGVLDKPNYKPEFFAKDKRPKLTDLAGRADALMGYYERETNTLIARPMEPLNERTTYAVIVTKRLVDTDGKPVGSPFKYINHPSQTQSLKHLFSVLPKGLNKKDIAFAFSFTTQSVESEWIAARQGLYEKGIQKHIGQQFPAKVSKLLKVRSTNPKEIKAYYPHMKNPYIIPVESWISGLKSIGKSVLGTEGGRFQAEAILESQKFIDFFAVGEIDSPRLFKRKDKDGKPLGLNEQHWPADLSKKKAEAFNEKLYFTLTVPRKEISARKDGKPAPIVLVLHGYRGNRFDAILFGGFFAKFGLASLSIDHASHGMGVSKNEKDLASLVVKSLGLSNFLESILEGRGTDQDGDGQVDSGADFFSAYLFHTCDMLRQTAFDWTNLVRVVKSFDGKKKFDFDLDGDKKNELAGDFDGDGQLDIGKDSPIYLFGASLGGITGTLVAGSEPHITAAVPVAAGGGLTDMTLRTFHGGIKQAIVLRVMGPIYHGKRSADGSLKIKTTVTKANKHQSFDIATFKGVDIGDTFVLINQKSGLRGCGIVQKNGFVRFSVESDRLDPHSIRHYKGWAIKNGSGDCELKDPKQGFREAKEFSKEVLFVDQKFSEGDPLVSLVEGLGIKRATPKMRQLLALGQIVLDKTDPVAYARHFISEPLEYPLLNEKTKTLGIFSSFIGDMDVPVSSAVSSGRASGLLEYIKDDPRYKKPVNQVLIDTFTIEGVHTHKRFKNSKGQGVHMDVENFSEEKDPWGKEIKRLSPGLHLFTDRDRDGNELGGFSGVTFPFSKPGGMHGFDPPGTPRDDLIKQCKKDCPAGKDCGCDEKKVFDIAYFLINQWGHYLSSGGQKISKDPCLSSNDCSFFQKTPPERSKKEQR